VTPEAIADAITKATAEEKKRAPTMHSVRPVRIDDGTVHAPIASRCSATSSWRHRKPRSTPTSTPGGAEAAHLLDLATEVGAALVKRHTEGAADVEVGVLDELAGLVDKVADRVESGEWSICPCGEDHGQSETDSGTVPIMRYHADLARRLRNGEPGDRQR
jgi:hypothetical protein